MIESSFGSNSLHFAICAKFPSENAVDSAEYGRIAPYVVHSADFGSEPIGDGMDGGGDQFITDLGLFRARMNSCGVPAGISEDWGRPDWISGENGVGLTDLGAEVKANRDYCTRTSCPSTFTTATCW